ncbi:MAG TPA: hypothetical protein VEY91_05965 [Candidatus Limnocylindria bacterium]|nr:hypothetical protein [Candidatus Limnocylindria bacterium]
MPRFSRRFARSPFPPAFAALALVIPMLAVPPARCACAPDTSGIAILREDLSASGEGLSALGGVARADRLQHASLAFAGGLAIGLVTHEPGLAAGGGLGLGLAKELFDRRHGGFDRGDLLADAVGAALAALAIAALGR